ncbi:hypothetical protein GUJ93_ZPchr0001g30723 [Zizania palustris]|uniref:Uncharacterized protein n=1 Tax=Zizania palustris TaxID=103762 RepID=A0A8J5RWV0_ZIZPA|nr:hypothetical protein GUJ93_ZPchr0001g30723 [Zizania palustris]
MSTQSDLNSVNPIEAALQAILRRLDNLDEKLHPLQPLQEKVAMLEESGPFPGWRWVLPRHCVLRRLLPRLRVATHGAAASSRARATVGHYVFLQSKEQGYFPSAHITIR